LLLRRVGLIGGAFLRARADHRTADCPDRGNTATISARARVSPGQNELMTGRVGTNGADHEHRPWLVPGVGSSF
jgi:hypothetical protein